jgi:hypothetical protein
MNQGSLEDELLAPMFLHDESAMSAMLVSLSLSPRRNIFASTGSQNILVDKMSVSSSSSSLGKKGRSGGSSSGSSHKGAFQSNAYNDDAMSVDSPNNFFLNFVDADNQTNRRIRGATTSPTQTATPSNLTDIPEAYTRPPVDIQAATMSVISDSCSLLWDSDSSQEIQSGPSSAWRDTCTQPVDGGSSILASNRFFEMF